MYLLLLNLFPVLMTSTSDVLWT